MLIMCIMMKFVEEWDFPILYIIKTIFISDNSQKNVTSKNKY